MNAHDRRKARRISVAKGRDDLYSRYMDFIRNQTSPETIEQDLAQSEILGQEILSWIEAGSPALEIIPPAGRFHTFVVGKWKVQDGEIVTWLEQVTEKVA